MTKEEIASSSLGPDVPYLRFEEIGPDSSRGSSISYVKRIWNREILDLDRDWADSSQ